MIHGRVARSVVLALLAAAVASCTPATSDQPAPATEMLPYENPDLAIERRVADLVSRLTLEEKVGQMLYDAPAVERLGIPAYNWWNEALHGVARAGRATVFPQAIGLAATWDTDLLYRVATAISDEARAKHHESARHGRRGIYEGLTFWSPNINIFRDPRWGRGMETYGEDPHLTGRLAVEFVRGMQGDHPRYLKTVATPKHYAVHSGPEPDRHTFNAVVGDRDLWETYLPAFRATVVEANAGSVMCAYNRFRDAPCCASHELLQSILRDEWSFDGYVVSDCWAIQDIHATHRVTATAAEAAALSVAAGTDLNCGVSYERLVQAVARGLIDEAAIDRAVSRLFRARIRLGLFDPPQRVPYASTPYDVVDSDEHRALALEAARKSIVLLKNDGALPLSKTLDTIAVIGPNAADLEVLLGNYNGVPSEPVTPLDGIRAAVSPSTTVRFVRGTDWAENTPALDAVPGGALRVDPATGQPGLRGDYFDNHDMSGRPRVTRTDSAIDFNWWQEAPAESVPVDSFSVRWSGALVPPTTGRYALGLRAHGGARLFLDDSLLVEFSDRHVVLTGWQYVELEADVPRAIRVEFFDRRADASVRLVWAPPDPGMRDRALDAARAADAVVLFLGLTPRLEGEEMPVHVPGFAGGDRTDLHLPDRQERLLRDVVAIGNPVVLVLLNGSALALDWAAERVPAIVEAWYPGQAAGTAIADVLFGDYNPAGRLPVTFYRSVEELPPFGDYDMAGRTYRYYAGEPLFAFGHGLSYTRFTYSDLSAPGTVRAGVDVDLAVTVTNTGDRPGEEVVQLYVSDLDASVPVPIRSLQGFQRVSLRPGQAKRVSFRLIPRQLSIIDGTGRRVVEPGEFELSVGGTQPEGEAAAKGANMMTARVRVTGPVVRLPR